MNLIFIISIIAISLGIGITFTYLILRPQLETTQKLNEEIINQNKELEEKNHLALETKQWLEGETKRLQDENSKLSLQKELTTEQINTLNNSIKTIEQQAQEAADLFYSDKMKVAQEHFEQALEEESKKYQDSVNNFQMEYQEVVNNLLQRHKKLEENNLKSKLILQVHDELIVEAVDSEIDIVKKIVKDEMENAVCLDVNLDVDLNIGDSWYDTKQVFYDYIRINRKYRMRKKQPI